MGSYCELSINGIGLFTVKNTFSGIHLKLFSPQEFIKIKEDLDGEEYERFLFRTTVKKAKTRLEILGCSVNKLKSYFNKGLEYQQSYYSDVEDEYDKQYYYYKNLTYENFGLALNLFLDSENVDISEDDIIVKYKYLANQIIIELIIEKLKSSFCLNPFFYDEIYENDEHLINHLLDIYMCIINSKEDAVIEYELTDIIDGGWIDKSEVNKFFSDFIDTTIIVTEGETDIKILSRSLEILYPEYKHLFTFFDFSNYSPAAGASYLVQLVKSFSAAKINNRIIALFDNDAAAKIELYNLSCIPILENIKVIQLPNQEFCNSYPTIGSSGIEYKNINGCAVSIELFFGDDIIKSDKGYYPIEFTNFNKKLGINQGCIREKSMLIKKMYKKLKRPDYYSQDWKPLRLLWKSIFEQEF